MLIAYWSLDAVLWKLLYGKEDLSQIANDSGRNQLCVIESLTEQVESKTENRDAVGLAVLALEDAHRLHPSTPTRLYVY